MDAPHRFTVGDRVLVHGGYDGDHSDWLRGGEGFRGTIRKLTAEAAAVELDQELVLDAPPGATWEDFGRGSMSVIRETDVARGRWLTLIHGWLEQTWADPVRLQVGLCEDEPDLNAIPRGGGIGYWVESHAGIALLPD
jgi:hypothetical protein